MPGGVAGVPLIIEAPYADFLVCSCTNLCFQQPDTSEVNAYYSGLFKSDL